MFAKTLKGLLGVAVVVAIAAYIARPRFPESASNHGLKTVVGLVSKFVHLIGDIGSMMGYSNINITRTIISTIILLATPVIKDNIKVETSYMDGVEVMIFQPTAISEVLRPGILYIHGGGWVMLSPAIYSVVCQEIAVQTQSVVVAVHYRKAPEHRYPIPLEDCLAATRYFLSNAEQYGVDKDKIGVKGDSAGGNLAMAVSLKLSKEGNHPTLKFMSLDYPALQAFDLNLPCYRKYENGPGNLDKNWMVKYWLFYAFGNNMTYFDLLYDHSHQMKYVLDSRYSEYVNPKLLPEHMQYSDSEVQLHRRTESVTIPKELTNIITDPLYAPLMASDEDLKLLPRAYVLNAEFDVLRDDGFILVERMRQLGLDVTHRYLSTEEHGFLNLVDIDPSIVDEVRRFATFYNRSVDWN